MCLMVNLIDDRSFGLPRAVILDDDGGGDTSPPSLLGRLAEIVTLLLVFWSAVALVGWFICKAVWP